MGFLSTLLVCVVALTACRRDDAVGHSLTDVPVAEKWQTGPTGDHDVKVAVVAGTAIFASDVAWQVRHTGQSVKEALDTLISFEVLAHQAKERQLTLTPYAQKMLRQAQVSRLVEDAFESSTGIRDIPQSDLRKLYDDAKNLFVHPRMVRVEYFAAGLAGLAPAEAAKRRVAFSASISEAKAKTVDGVISEADFGAAFSGAGVERQSVLIEDPRQGWERTAFAMSREGQWSQEPWKTDDGDMVAVRAYKVFTESKLQFEDVHSELRDRWYGQWRARQFAGFVEPLMKKYDAQILLNSPKF